MTTSYVIDNRRDRLVDEITSILSESSSAKFAVGYFFLSGFEALGQSLDNLGELRLLIGNTTNRETIEQLSEAYKRLDLVADQSMRSSSQRADREVEPRPTAENLRETVGLMDQTDSAREAGRDALMRHGPRGRLKVRVYTKGRLHAKAYIFDLRPLRCDEESASASSEVSNRPSPASRATSRR